MFKFVAVVGALMSLLGPSAANGPTSTGAVDRADGAALSVEVVTVLGTGCPAGTTTVVPMKDPYSFGVLYRSFTVNGDDYKNCQLVVDVSAPSGVTYTVYAVSKGYAHIDSGAYARLQTSSYLTGSPYTSLATYTIKGPFDDTWQARSDAEDTLWAPCGTDAFFNINNTIRVDGPKSSVMSLASSALGEGIMTVIHVQWRSC